MPEPTHRTLSLPTACLRARRSRERLLNAIYAGSVAAEQHANGRWSVDLASLDAFLAREQGDTATRSPSLREAYAAASAA